MPVLIPMIQGRKVVFTEMKCITCNKPAMWVRCTQFAGQHPYCEEHSEEESDFLDDDSSTYWKQILDSAGKPPSFLEGDRVWVGPAKMEATVIKQILHYDMNETFWGNLELMYDDGVKGTSHCWQVKKI